MIKTKIIETSKAKILVVGGLPEDTDKDSIENVRNEILYYYTGVSPNHAGEEIKIPPGKWQPIGFLKDITEDVAKKLVESTEYYDPHSTPFAPIPAYKGYLDNVYKWEATESLHSLIAANCQLRNKYGELPHHNKYIALGKKMPSDTWLPYKEHKVRWQEEQEKVFTNPYLLKKID